VSKHRPELKAFSAMENQPLASSDLSYLDLQTLERRYVPFDAGNQIKQVATVIVTAQIAVKH